jgi:phosphonate transport system substrate-binding protein
MVSKIVTSGVLGKILLSLPLVWLVGCSQPPVGSKKRPFTMYYIPSVDAQKITTTADKVTQFVSRYVSQKLYGQDSGFYVKSAVPASYIAVVESFGTKKADFAALTTFSYILAKDIKKYDVEAVLEVLRGNNERTYKAQIIAHKDSNIKTLEDLKGKKFAFTDPASTSGYILPSKLFKDKGIQLGETVFAQKHDNVVTMVYQKQVDAGATYYSAPKTTELNGKKIEEITDARARVKTQFPDVEDKVKIIGFTQEIPNEPWVLRSNLLADPQKNKELKDLIVESLLEFVKTDDGKEMLTILATGSGLERVGDSEYNDIRQIVLQSNLDIEKIVAK